MSAVISASRRTDLPAFYTPWLLNRLHAGFCEVLNPYNGQAARVSLAAQDVIALALWTRNPIPLMRRLPELDRLGMPYFFNITLTGLPRSFEAHAPDADAMVQAIQRLSQHLSPRHIRWRYDPILISSITPAAYHRQRFSDLARALAGSVDSCTFSFVQFYGKTRRNLSEAAQRAGVAISAPDLAEQQDLAAQLARIAAQNGMRFQTCCNDLLLVDGVTKSHCIDLELIRAIAPGRAEALRAKPTRPDCGCAASIDIGAYDTCRFDCAYCYATRSPGAARQRFLAHDPCDSLLWRPETLRNAPLPD